MIARSALMTLLLLANGCASVPAAPAKSARPVRVMSLNQCTDQLVLALLPPDRIASVTWLSRDPRFSSEVAAARTVAANRGTVEEVARTAPDLIVTDTFSNPAGRVLLRRLGYPMLEVDDAGTVDDIRRNVRRIAAAVGERARGDAMIARMDRALTPDPDHGLRVAAWDRDGMASGPMLRVVLKAAGLTDVGQGAGDVETLLATAPDLLIDREDHAPTPSLGDNRGRHRLVRERWTPDRRLTIPRASLFCATPAIGTAAMALKRQVRALRGAGA
ncbi:MAG: ABC transporter substrate-binding protein [Pseudomonadota bacterium]